MLTGLGLLVLEDDRDTRELFAASLTKLGAEVRSASTAEAALAYLETWRPDAVLCDLHMPGVDGYSFLAQVQQLPALRGMPVIAISASHPDIERSRALEAGFAAHLTKPSKLSDIISAVTTLVQRERSRTAPCAS
ncbi:MAG: response regulator [Deltaproteobacteria bacterium]|nr:response regulator [Deltaproteobacteria bacterium]